MIDSIILNMKTTTNTHVKIEHTVCINQHEQQHDIAKYVIRKHV